MQHVINNSEQPTVSYFHESNNPEGKKEEEQQLSEAWTDILWSAHGRWLQNDLYSRDEQKGS